ncbi:MAG TPA: hypothetical protein VLU73_09400 [Methylococcaceae bacterium]|jgi:hypothetical protein|nr:hypothetical protein [Methylococcaceae bacterium]
MLGGVVAVLIAFWFYRTADSKRAPAMQWAVAGVISYYVPNIIWSLTVAKPILQTLHAQSAPIKAGLIGHSSVIIGALCAGLVWYGFLRKLKTPEQGN